MTAPELRDRVVELLLDTLDPAERADVEAALSVHPDAKRLRAEARALLAAMADELPAERPRQAARTRLMAAAAPRPRLAGLLSPLSRFLDLDEAAAGRVLALVDDAAVWVAAPLPGVALCDLDLQPGPAPSGARVGLVRLAPGVAFPHHTHFGDEQTLVLQGALRDDTGRVLRRGETLHQGPGTAHTFTALPGPDLVFAVILHGGISLPDFE